MNEILNNEPVQRVDQFIKKFDPKLKIMVLNNTARTAKDASKSLGCELGAIIKSLVFHLSWQFGVLNVRKSLRYFKNDAITTLKLNLLRPLNKYTVLPICGLKIFHKAVNT